MKNRPNTKVGSFNSKPLINKLTFIILLLFLLGSAFSCKKECIDTQPQLNPLVLTSKSYYEKNFANSPSYSFNATNLSFNWEHAEIVKQKFVSSFNPSGTIKNTGTSLQSPVQPHKFELDRWGNIELFPSTTDYSFVKIPVTLKLRNSEVIKDNLFIYIGRDNKGVTTISMVQYSKNISANKGCFTGKILIISSLQGKTKTIALNFNENKVDGFADLSLLKKTNNYINYVNTSNVPLKSYGDCEVMYYMECPLGLSYNADIDLCEMQNGTGCSGFYMDECGNRYSACEGGGSGSLPKNIDRWEGDYWSGGMLYLSFHSLNQLALGTTVSAVIIAFIPPPLGQIISSILVIYAASFYYLAAENPTGVIFYIIFAPGPSVIAITKQ